MTKDQIKSKRDMFAYILCNVKTIHDMYGWLCDERTNECNKCEHYTICKQVSEITKGFLGDYGFSEMQKLKPDYPEYFL